MLFLLQKRLRIKAVIGGGLEVEVPEQEEEGPIVGGIFPNQTPLPLTLWETRFIKTPSGKAPWYSAALCISQAYEGRNEKV